MAFPSIRRSFSGVSTAELSRVLNAYNIVFGRFGRDGSTLYDILPASRVQRETHT